jgi:MoaA/NifB/PqqE/SkfB family radical SAM enzyme
MAIECLGLELTNRCDLACGHCLRAIVPPNSPRGVDIPLDLTKRIISEARAAGIPHVGMTGGEPMLHPDFLAIIDHIIDEGLTYHVLSNGLGLPAFLPRWLTRPERRAKLRDVCVSIDGATQATHDAIRGKGTFRRSLAGLAVLRAHRIPFTLLHTITRVSKDEIDQLGLMAHHLGAERLIVSHFLPNGRPGASTDLDLTTAERHDVEFVVKRLIDALRFPVIMAEGYYTPVVDHVCATVDARALNIDPNGHLTFCCELSNFYGDGQAPESRKDFVVDMRNVSVAQALAAMSRKIGDFRAERIAEDAAGGRSEDDKFACRYCVRHFGKPQSEIVPLRRRTATSVGSAVG